MKTLQQNTVVSTKTQLVNAAPLAVSGALGAEFWAEVEARALARAGAEKSLIEPRKIRD